MKVYKTTDPVAAVRALDLKYDTTLVRCGNYANLSPIRFRPSWVQDLEPIVCRDRLRLEQIEKWNTRGGLLAYQANQRAYEPLPLHQAQFLSESPESFTRFEFFTAVTTECAVIYRPPEWDQHYHTVNMRKPHPNACQALLDVICDEGYRSPWKEPDLCARLGIPKGTIIDDRAIMDALLLDQRAFTLARKVTMGTTRYRVVRPLRLRLPPEDQGLLALYEGIREQPLIDDEHMVVGSALGKHYQWWRAGLRKLVRGHNIARGDAFAIYYVDHMKLNAPRILDRHLIALNAMNEVTSWVDSLPVFQTR